MYIALKNYLIKVFCHVLTKNPDHRLISSIISLNRCDISSRRTTCWELAVASSLLVCHTPVIMQVLHLLVEPTRTTLDTIP